MLPAMRSPPPAGRSIRSLDDAAGYLEGLIDVERRPDFPYARLGLEAVQGLLERVGNPERGLSVLHVAGSKGKGSTALLAESVLRAAGERVGTFTSPHLERWTERFRVDGREVPGARLAAAVERLRPHVDALRREDPARAPTFFDATTAAALLVFADAGIERAILEVGLGGRLDSTNVVDPAVTCITTIELEHTDKLGGTLAAIAGEKAGIVKPGRPLVLGALPAEAEVVVRERARERGAPLAHLGVDFTVDVLEATTEGLVLRLRDGPLDVEAHLPALGRHQAANAALAVACVRRLGALDGLAGGASEAAVRSGLARAVLPARVEVVSRAPWILIDAAHTAASARALAEVLAGIARTRCHLVLSVSGGKDLGAILAALLPHADRVSVTRAEPSRSLAPTEVAAAVRAASPATAVRAIPNPHLALRAARDELAAHELLCVAGSVYLAGIARHLFVAPAPGSRPRAVAS
jgi:dihydrofolate synthase/folylpolyglutamate synthase